MTLQESAGDYAGALRLLEEVLATNGHENMRASKMTQDDFLNLLATFNEKGIHFA